MGISIVRNLERGRDGLGGAGLICCPERLASEGPEGRGSPVPLVGTGQGWDCSFVKLCVYPHVDAVAVKLVVCIALMPCHAEESRSSSPLHRPTVDCHVATASIVT